MTEPLDQQELRRRWQRTLGPTVDWSALDPLATQRPEDTGSTLSGLATVGATLSGGDTLHGTLSCGQTLPTDGSSPSIAGTAGGYELAGELGRGGMGVVYRARQRSLARDIALKFVRPEQAGAGTRERFVSEALVNGLLDHPNIVPVHELGANERGEVFLAMKLVGGRSWKALLHPQTADERATAAGYDLDRHLGVLQGVGNAIAFAHSRGIVHRDLKPENVMVGEFGEVLVMDWGIAVDIRDTPDGDQRAQHKSTVTAPSGTPSYMAPELAEGRGRDIGPHTDVYLLGAILHEVLTGQPPHRGRTLMEVLLSAARSAQPSYDAAVPAGLGAIAAQAMHVDPAKRFPDVAGFQAAIADYLKHRESEKIGTAARERLAEAEGMADVDTAARNRRYGAFAEAVAGFRQALALWDGNGAAAAGERSARLAYARAALAAGDLGLADAQLEPLPADADAGLRAQIAMEREAAGAKDRAARRNRWLLAGATGAIVIGLGNGAMLINAERAQTAKERDRAIAQEALAKEQEAMATRERDKAVAAQATAVAAQAETERAQAGIRRRSALNAAAETVHADATREPGLGLLWMGEALDRDVPGGSAEAAWRMGLAGRLLGLPTPIGGGGADRSWMAGDRHAQTYVQGIFGTEKRNLAVALLYELGTDRPGTSTLATWDPTTGGDVRPVRGAGLENCGWAVSDDRRQILLVPDDAPWVLWRREADDSFRQVGQLPDSTTMAWPLFSSDGRWIISVVLAEIRIHASADLSLIKAIPLRAGKGTDSVQLSLDGGWLLIRDGEARRAFEIGTWAEAALPAGAAECDTLVAVAGGKWAVALRSTEPVVLRRTADGWAASTPVRSMVARVLRMGKEKESTCTMDGDRLVLADENATARFTFTDRGSELGIDWTNRTHYRPTLRQRLTDLLPFHREEGYVDHRADPTPRLRAGDLAIEERTGLALLSTSGGAVVAFDLAKPAVSATVTRLAPTAARASATTSQHVPMVLANEDGLYTDRGNLPNRAPTPIPFTGSLEGATTAGLADAFAVAHGEGFAVYRMPGMERADAPWPVHAGCAAGGRVVGSAEGRAFALVRPALAGGGCVVWTAATSAPTQLRGPREVPGSTTALPSDDGSALLLGDGTVLAMEGGAARPWRAGDPLPVRVGATPVRVPRMLSTVYSTYARDSTSGRMRALRCEKVSGVDEGASGLVWVDEYTGPEAIGTFTRRSRVVELLLIGGDTMPQADLSPDGQFVLAYRDFEDEIGLYEAASMHLLAAYSIGDLLGDEAADDFGNIAEVGWGDGNRLRITSQREDEPVALIDLPSLTRPIPEVSRWLGAFSLRRLDETGTIVDLAAGELQAAVKAGSR